MNKKTLAKLVDSMRGKPVEEIEHELAKIFDLSYRGGHTAPIASDSTAKITELSKIYPDDVYGPNAARYYGHLVPYDYESMNVLQSVKGKDNAPVTIYRALPKVSSKLDEIKNLKAQKDYILKYGKLPKGSSFYESKKPYDEISERIEQLNSELASNPEVIKKPEIIPGDWVTASKSYAKHHARGIENPTVIQKTVPAGELYTDANSIHELGWWPFKGAVFMPISSTISSEMDPLKKIRELVNVYRTNQEKVADAITRQVTQPFGEADEMQKNIMRFGLDPINLVPGAAGVGFGALEIMGKRED